MNRLYVFALVILILSGCNSNRKIKLGVFLPGSDTESAGLELKEALAERGWTIDVINGTNEEVIEGIESGKLDMGILLNDISIDNSKLSSISPLYYEVFVVLQRDSLEYGTEMNVVDFMSYLREGSPKIMMGAENSVTHNFSVRLLDYLQVDPESYEPLFIEDNENFRDDFSELVKKENPDIIFMFLGLDSKLAREVLKLGYRFRNTDPDAVDMDKGYVTGLSLKMPRTFPTVIPAYHFGREQPAAVATLGIHSILVCDRDYSDTKVYEFLRSLVRSLPKLTRMNTNFKTISADHELGILNYPFHEGAIQYQERGEPSLFERYAELAGVLFSISVVLITTLRAQRRRRLQRKKDKADDYILEVMQVRKRTDIPKALDLLDSIEEKALHSLIDEKLAADGSTQILLQLIENVRRELLDKH